jgi:uncharacterized RDD family membrane protein YckC
LIPFRFFCRIAWICVGEKELDQPPTILQTLLLGSRPGEVKECAEKVSPLVQCPQCGFQEFDDHSGCAVCGFRPNAALETGDPALKPSSDNLIKFPLKTPEAERTAATDAALASKLGLPLFERTAMTGKTTEGEAGSGLFWKEELQQKLRDYRARRDVQKKERVAEDFSAVSAKREGPPEFVEDLADLGRRFPLAPTSEKEGQEPFSLLDEKFKLPPSSTTPQDLQPEPEIFSPGKPKKDVGKFPGPEPTSPPTASKPFELPSSVQRIKQQRQSTRRSELFQHPLLFEGPITRHETHADDEHLPLPYCAASAWDRFLAAIVDFLIIVFVVAICLIPVIAMSRHMDWPLHPSPRSLLSCLIVTIVFALGYCFFFVSVSSKTLGMQWRHLTLLNFTGQPPTLKEAALRTLGYLVSAGSLMLGFLWLLFDVDALAWHDRISRTYPVHSHKVTPQP